MTAKQITANEVIVEVVEVQGCKVHKVGDKWILPKKTVREGTEIHDLWPGEICSKLLIDIWNKVLAMRYGGYWSNHDKWERGDCYRAGCFDVNIRVICDIKRVQE